MSDHHSSRLRVAHRNGVATVTIDNPPVNVLSYNLMGELRRFLEAIRDDAETRVIVFESANPDFFIAHVDMLMTEQPEVLLSLQGDLEKGVNPFQALNELLRAQPQLTIVKLAGLARGGGAEFVAAADMAFAAVGQAGLAQCEALLGIIPGGGATQYLGERMTRGRALEAILGADLFDAATAERYGWINRALPADELNDYVDRLANNVAALPDGIIAAVKAAMGDRLSEIGFNRESAGWSQLAFHPTAARLMAEALAAGAQTPAAERDFEGLLRKLIQRGSAPVTTHPS